MNLAIVIGPLYLNLAMNVSIGQRPEASWRRRYFPDFLSMDEVNGVFIE